ncbi:TIGR01440 family protein [Streptococcus sanguinis]|jgi:TIGR01440 family protein|uniref:TIGR01440 family protein n=1 Tax=Streptococcus sanguinis TaxID=1305 RepID=UPI0039C1B0CF
MDLAKIGAETRQIVLDVLDKATLVEGDIFVLGLSSSEVVGGHIGQNSSLEVGQVIVKTILDVLEEKGIFLAVQGCEHLNRALVVERALANKKDLEIVNVLPTLHAGGSGQLAAFQYMKDPVEVEFIVAQAGLDIGDTAIGMHVKHVQIPIRPTLKELGAAHVTALASRPKLIGGARAAYLEDKIRKGQKEK